MRERAVREVEKPEFINGRAIYKSKSNFTYTTHKPVELDLELTGRQNYVCSIFLIGSFSYGNFKRVKDINLIRKWGQSLQNTGLNGIMFHNCFTENDIDSFLPLPVTFVKVDFPKGLQSGLFRYELYNTLIEKYADFIDNAFFTDSTDLDVLKNPCISPNYRTDKIYIGCEPKTTDNRWMIEIAKHYPKYLNLLKKDRSFGQKILLNAGLCGGSLKAITPFIKRMAEECISVYRNSQLQDMAIINYIGYTEFSDKISFGSQVNTIFTKQETDNKVAWFRHK